MEKNNFVKIKPNECKGCKVCVTTCPKGCLYIGSEINKIGYQYAKFKNNGCIACGLCFYVCPEIGAITVYKDEEEQE